MSESWESQLTPEAAERLLSGASPLRELMGVPLAELMDMATQAHHLWRQGRRGDAIVIYKGIIALDANAPWGHAGLGLSELESGNYAAAEAHLRKAVAADANDPSISVNLAECLIRLDRLADAIAIMKALLDDPAKASHPGTIRAAAILQGIFLGMKNDPAA